LNKEAGGEGAIRKQAVFSICKGRGGREAIYYSAQILVVVFWGKITTDADS